MIRGGQFGESAKALLGNALKKMGLSAENIENVSDDGKGSATVTVNTNGKSSQDLKDAIEGKPLDVKQSANKWLRQVDELFPGVDTHGALSRIKDLDGCIAQASERVKGCDDNTLEDVVAILRGDFMSGYDRPFMRLTACLNYPGIAAGLGYQDKKTIEKELNDLEDNYVQTYLSAIVAKRELDSRKAK